MRERAALYVRVSTEEQKAGWSPDDQAHTLTRESERRGEEVVEIIRLDEGYSGADPDRPGLKRIMELAEAGEIDVVRATKRDRLFRSRLYRLLMDRDLADYGVRLEAMNDVGVRMGDGLLDEFAEFEREQITERMMGGKRQKARAGKIIAGHVPNFGFRFTEDRDGYEVDEATMLSVRRMFSLVASGESLSATARALNEESLPAPGRRWTRHLVRQLVLDDVYRPHPDPSVFVASGQMTEMVADTLSGPFGVWWYNRTETSKARRRNRVREKQPEEWIAVPVPYSGIPAQTVEAARRVVERQERSPKSTAAGREWELSGGILRCAGCGNAMLAVGGSAYRNLKSGKKRYVLYNYRCDTRRNGGECLYGKTISAKKAEGAVWQAVRAAMLHPERLEESLSRAAKKERNQDSERRIRSVTKVLEEQRKKRDGLIDIASDGLISRSELAERLTPVDAQIKALQGEIESLAPQAKPTQIDPRMLLRRMKSQAPEVLDNLNAEGRRKLYLDLGLVARFEPGLIKVEWFAGLPLREIQLKSADGSKPTRENELKIYAEVSLSSGECSFSVA